MFVTGTRAELGLMVRTLGAIRAHPRLSLAVVATGMHLDPRSGRRLSALRAAGIEPDAVVPWAVTQTPSRLAEVTGEAVARLARAYRELEADAVLVVGDRVEAFAAASAAHVARLPLAHVHGGDRAEGQVDDALRHAITQLAHLHLAATDDARDRILRLGQHPGSVFVVGAPGVESIRDEAASRAETAARFPDLSGSAVVLLHPATPDEGGEHARATSLLRGLRLAGMRRILLLSPNNDPGCDGVRRAIRAFSEQQDVESVVVGDLPRPLFLGLLRDCRLLAGNSSAGIIEAASFGTPVLNVGPRQHGRLHGPNVTHAGYAAAEVARAVRAILARPRPSGSDNPYHRPRTARRIADLLAAKLPLPPAPPKLLTH